ncbi:metallophosphoesterase [Pseudomonas viridiflava]|uniref:metallophosphoesterase n=1 Tax=Pseudomonas syringae group TaxID=136849 RepID=UPI000F0163BE|nr:metallophosphoesterase [Pseudomonas viridiflava]
MKQRVLRLPRNEVGRDFVVGDIHFKTIELHQGLQKLGFDSKVDRVIGVGDLIDRGPGVLDGLKLLGEPWFFAVQGNHEQMLINAYRENPNVRYSANGAGWWSTIADESKELIISKLESLPTIIEIESAHGVVGVVHADVPTGLSWQAFVRDIGDPKVEENAIWGRERIKKHVRDGISGVWRVCVGHTRVPEAIRLGNLLALDCTGGGDGPLAIYCVQEDAIHVDGRSVALDQSAVLTKMLTELEKTQSDLKATLNAGKLIESQAMAREADHLARRTNTAWLSLQPEIDESQKFLNALQELSLVSADRRKAKLKKLSAKYEGTPFEGLLTRLFG